MRNFFTWSCHHLQYHEQDLAMFCISPVWVPVCELEHIPIQRILLLQASPEKLPPAGGLTSISNQILIILKNKFKKKEFGKEIPQQQSRGLSPLHSLGESHLLQK